MYVGTFNFILYIKPNANSWQYIITHEYFDLVIHIVEIIGSNFTFSFGNLMS